MAADATAPALAEPFRVLVVDPSAVLRGTLRRALGAAPGIALAAAVGDARAAAAALKREPVDVAVVASPPPAGKGEGEDVLPALLAIDPGLRVIVVVPAGAASAEAGLAVLSAGAVDCLARPAPEAGHDAARTFHDALIGRIRVLGAAKRARPSLSPALDAPPAAGGGGFALRRPSPLPPVALAIGSSTGGPQALLKLLQALGPDFALPILVTQHMPATFTAILAAHLGKASARAAGEAIDGETVRAGRVYVAPGDLHMLVEPAPGGGAAIRLSRAAPENFCRPSVDPMLRSAAQAWGPRLVAAILTGMGHDGLAGGRCVVEAGGTLLAQDEATSVVWGMPGAVAAAGLCSAVLPLGALAARIRRLAGREAA